MSEDLRKFFSADFAKISFVKGTKMPAAKDSPRKIAKSLAKISLVKEKNLVGKWRKNNIFWRRCMFWDTRTLINTHMNLYSFICILDIFMPTQVCVTTGYEATGQRPTVDEG